MTLVTITTQVVALIVLLTSSSETGPTGCGPQIFRSTANSRSGNGRETCKASRSCPPAPSSDSSATWPVRCCSPISSGFKSSCAFSQVGGRGFRYSAIFAGAFFPNSGIRTEERPSGFRPKATDISGTLPRRRRYFPISPFRDNNCEPLNVRMTIRPVNIDSGASPATGLNTPERIFPTCRAVYIRVRLQVLHSFPVRGWPRLPRL